MKHYLISIDHLYHQDSLASFCSYRVRDGRYNTILDYKGQFLISSNYLLDDMS